MRSDFEDVFTSAELLGERLISSTPKSMLIPLNMEDVYHAC